MTTPTHLRLTLYTLLAVVAIGQASGRILSTQRVYEPGLFRVEGVPGDRRSKWPTERPAAMPTFGSNDRSRWATVRALVDKGTFVIGQRRTRSTLIPQAVGLLGVPDPLFATALAEFGYALRVKKGTSDTGIIFEDGWESVDKVLRPDTYEFYSSKPPLLSVLMAGLYWLLKNFLGWSLADHPDPAITFFGVSVTSHPDLVVRTSLLLVNIVPFALYLALLAKLLERYSGNDWAKVVVFTAACFATIVTPFHITFNNHTIATCCVLFALYLTLEILEHKPNPPASVPDREGGAEGPNPPAPFPLREGGAKPGPSPLRGGVGGRSSDTWWRYLLAGLLAGFVVCNELPALAFAAGLGLVLLLHSPARALALYAPAVAVPLLALVALNYFALEQLRPAYSEFGSEWYTYEGSHWRNASRRTGIDFARNAESPWLYAVHVLIGHHGLFALTPLWLLSFAAMFRWTLVWLSRRSPAPVSGKPEAQALAMLPLWLFPATLALSIIVIGFYLYKSDNYGGWTNGLRWLMWLTPLWLLCLLPALERLAGSRWGRGLVYLLLGLSVLAVSFAPWNPWRHPYLYDWMEALGWVRY